MLRALLLAPALALVACQNMPPAFAPPEQRSPLPDFRRYRVSRIVNMSDGDAMEHAVSDILGPVDSWSWTGKRPAVRIRPKRNQNLRYVIDFAIAGATIKDTGPVSITFLVNDHQLDTLRYDTFGVQQYMKEVPPEWVRPGEDNIIGAEIDKVWVSPTDGTRFGFILTRIGLTEEQ